MSKPPKRPECPLLDEYLDFPWRAESVESDYLQVRRDLHAALAGTKGIKLGNCYRWIHYAIGISIDGRFSTFAGSHGADTPPLDDRAGRRDPLAYIAIKALLRLPRIDRLQVASAWVDGFVSRVATTHDYLLITPLMLDTHYPVTMRLEWLHQWLSNKDSKSLFQLPVMEPAVQALRTVSELNIMLSLSIASSLGISKLAAWCASDFRGFWSSREAGDSVPEILAKHAPEVIPFWDLAIALGLSPADIASHLVQHFEGADSLPLPATPLELTA